MRQTNRMFKVYPLDDFQARRRGQRALVREIVFGGFRQHGPNGEADLQLCRLFRHFDLVQRVDDLRVNGIVLGGYFEERRQNYQSVVFRQRYLLRLVVRVRKNHVQFHRVA